MAKVKVYSTPACPYCSILKAFLVEHNVNFEDIDVSMDKKAAAEMIKKTGQRGVPVIEIDGNIIIGFEKEKIASALGIKLEDEIEGEKETEQTEGETAKAAEREEKIEESENEKESEEDKEVEEY